jgi:hypothetical protein
MEHKNVTEKRDTISFSKENLLKKFPFLDKYQNLDWFKNLTIYGTGNAKDIPFLVCIECLKNLEDFLESTKFTSRWEEGFSVKIKIKQIVELLGHFTSLSGLEKTREGV